MPETSPAAPVLPDAVRSAVAALFDSAVAEHRTSGVTWAIIGGHDHEEAVLAHGAAGHRELDGGVPAAGSSPMDRASVSRIASMTKSFTAATLLALRDEGRLRLEAPVSTYLPEAAGAFELAGDEREPTLRELLTMIRGAGYRESIIVQDRIPGDDQYMRILTVYCDADSRVRFASYGHTLLEEHAPGAIGNPAAIITGVDREMVAQAQRLCEELGWVGYANFDLKHDRRDGRTKFFELNPRLGRSNYYVTAGGHNPVTWYVDEHLRAALPQQGPGSGIGEDGILQEQPEVLYTVVPLSLVKRYTTLPEARARLRRVLKARRIGNPLHYPGVDDSLSRRRYILAASLNSVLKFQRYYRPEGGDRFSRLLRRRSGAAAEDRA